MWWIIILIVLVCACAAFYFVFGNRVNGGNNTSQSTSGMEERLSITKKDAEEVMEIIRSLEEIYRT